MAGRTPRWTVATHKQNIDDWEERLGMFVNPARVQLCCLLDRCRPLLIGFFERLRFSRIQKLEDDPVPIQVFAL